MGDILNAALSQLQGSSPPAPVGVPGSFAFPLQDPSAPGRSSFILDLLQAGRPSTQLEALNRFAGRGGVQPFTQFANPQTGMTVDLLGNSVQFNPMARAPQASQFIPPEVASLFGGAPVSPMFTPPFFQEGFPGRFGTEGVQDLGDRQGAVDFVASNPQASLVASVLGTTPERTIDILNQIGRGPDPEFERGPSDKKPPKRAKNRR